MNFIDNYGHVFSFPSFDKKPIGYQYEENPYIFWMDDGTENKLSINNYYVKIVNLLLDDKNLSNIEITCESERFKLMKYSQVKDSINNISINDDFSYSLSGDFNNENDEDILCIKLEGGKCIVPIYIIGTSDTEGSWYTNILIKVTYTTDEEEYSFITVGGVFVDECEQLVINGRNMGIDLPKDIIKAVYQGSYYNEEFNTQLYNEKLKEYLMNYMGIKGELGNFNSVENSLKWFGWGNHLSVSKLLQTDNEFKTQFIRDYFDIKCDLLKSFETFRNSTYISLKLELNKELNTENLFDFTKDFWGEGKPQLESLMDKEIIVESNVKNSLKYIKKYYDYSFNELGLKLCCLKNFLEKYFLPIHLSIHSLSMNENCFANDIKFVSAAKESIIEKLVYTPNNDINVKFPEENTFYFNKQIHFVDENLNEFNINDLSKILDSNNNYFYINDTCINIPIDFESNSDIKYFNCNLILEKKNKNVELIQKIKFNNIKFNINSDLLFLKNNRMISDGIEYSFSYDNKTFSDFYKDLDELKEILVYNSKVKDKIDIKLSLGDNNKYSFISEDSKEIEIFANKESIEYITINGKLDYYIIPKQEYIDLINGEYYISIYKVLDFYLEIKTNESNIDTIIDNDNEYIVFNDFDIYQSRNYEKCFESSFSFIDNGGDSKYKNFIIYPKVMGKNNDSNNVSGEISYWTNQEFKLSLLVNNKWYFYDFTCKIANPDIKLGKLKYQYWDNDLNYSSKFNQINDIKDGKIKFNSFMHNPNSVMVNHINFHFDYIKYSILHNLKYIDGTNINIDDFYQIVLLNGQKIYIHKSYYGKDFTLNSKYINETNRNLLFIYIYNDIQFLILEQEDPYGYPVFVITEDNEPYNIVLENSSDENELEDMDLYFEYDYYKNIYNVYYDEEKNFFTKSEIIDMLHSSKDTLLDKYVQKLNIPTNNKSFLNNIHLFNLYKKSQTTEFLDFNEPKILVNQTIINDNVGYNVNLSFLSVKYNNGEIVNEINLLDVNETDLSLINYEINDYSYVYFTDNNNVPVNNIFYITENNAGESNIYNDLYCEFFIDKLRINASNKIEFDTDINNVINVKTYSIDGNFNSGNDEYELLNNEYNVYIKNDNTKKMYLIKESKLCGLENSTNYEIYSLNFKTEFYIKENNKYVKFILDSKNFMDFYKTITNPNNDKYKIKIICYQANEDKHYSKINEYAINEFVKKDDINGYYGGLEYKDDKLEECSDDNASTVKLYKRLNIIQEEKYSKNGFINVYTRKINKEYLMNNKEINHYQIKFNYTEEEAKKIINSKLFHFYLYQDNKSIFFNSVEYLLNGYKLTKHNEFGFDLSKDIYFVIYCNKDILEDVNKYIDDNIFKISYSISCIYDSGYELFKYDISEEGLDDRLNTLSINIDDKQYIYGGNSSERVIDLYKTFFTKKLIYGEPVLQDNGEITYNNEISLWDCDDNLVLNTYLEYDFYLMHDNNYWYGLYISKDTIDKCIVEKDLILSESDKVKTIDVNGNKDYYKLEYVKSDNRFLLNRMLYIDSNGINHFNNDDLIVAKLENNDRLPVNIFNGSKWSITPISVGIPDISPIESNCEMCILSLPKNNNEYYRGYYDVNVRYSLDRFSNQQFLKTTKLLIK